MCLALKVIHPDVLDEMLTPDQFEDWIQYYMIKPFGHWVDNEMRAAQTAAWTGKIEMPSIVPVDERDEEEVVASLPGASGAEEFLRSLKNGNR